MDKPWKVILAFVGVFIAGAVFGGVFTLRASGKRLAGEVVRSEAAGQQPAVGPKRVQPKGQLPGQSVAQPRVNPITPVLMRQFTRSLSLTTEQKDRVGTVVARAGEDLLRLRQENFADTQRVIERMFADVSAALSPEQRVELEKMRFRELQEKLQAERQKAERQKAERQKAERQKKSEKTESAPEGANRATPPAPARGQ